MFLLTCWAGLRVTEVASLRVCDVIGLNGRALQEIRLQPEQTKGKWPRTVFLNERLQKEITTYAATRAADAPTDPFFYTQKRKTGWNRNTLAQHFFWLYHAAGIAGASSHSGRRTFCTNLASKGISIRVLQSLAGHRSVQTTARYIDVNDHMKRRAVESV